MRFTSKLAALVPCLLALCSACSNGTSDQQNRGVTNIGGLRVGPGEENTAVETALSVGEWAYNGTSQGADGVKEFLWLCGGGHAAYRREGQFARAAFPDVSSGQLKKGTFQVFGDDYVKTLQIRLDGADAAKSFDLSTTDEDGAFTLSSKRFVRTNRGCELAYN